jgi:hypothetical protein
MLDGITIDTRTTNCKAKNSDGIHCTLDAVHNDFGGEHMGRDAQGITVFWKNENNKVED